MCLAPKMWGGIHGVEITPFVLVYEKDRCAREAKKDTKFECELVKLLKEEGPRSGHEGHKKVANVCDAVAIPEYERAD